MRDQVYNALRNEATQNFTSVRQLMIGEFAAYSVVIAELLKAPRFEHILALQIVAAGIVFFSALFGRDWFVQATRQNSYIMVFYELPQFFRARRTGDPDRFTLWILANRSEAYSISLAIKGKKTSVPDLSIFRSHRPGVELRSFLLLQELLLGLSVVGAVIASIILFSGTTSGTTIRHNFGTEWPLLSATIVALLVVAIYLVREWLDSADIANRLTANWLAYWAKRDAVDLDFIADRKFDRYLHS